MGGGAVGFGGSTAGESSSPTIPPAKGSTAAAGGGEDPRLSPRINPSPAARMMARVSLSRAGCVHEGKGGGEPGRIGCMEAWGWTIVVVGPPSVCRDSAGTGGGGERTPRGWPGQRPPQNCVPNLRPAGARFKCCGGCVALTALWSSLGTDTPPGPTLETFSPCRPGRMPDRTTGAEGRVQSS